MTQATAVWVASRLGESGFLLLIKPADLLQWMPQETAEYIAMILQKQGVPPQ